MGLRQLQILDVEGLHILATCLVNYKGQRVIA
jgi:protein TIF31